MNIHEYQAKVLMRKFNINVLDGKVAKTAQEAEAVARELGGELWVVKAQIHAGGRGKAGGVKVARSFEEVSKHAEDVLGKTLVTHQTGPEGKKVHSVLVETGCDIGHEYYLGLYLDRKSSRITFIASQEGGGEIEKIALESPEKVIRVGVEAAVGFTPFISRKLCAGLGLKGEQAKKASVIFENLYKLYTECDCTLAEINPMVLTKGGDFVALDAKLCFDDNALTRHPEIAVLRDETEEKAEENLAIHYGFAYASLPGDIGCMVNGAGLAMATMDTIKFHGGEPANFLDIGGGASKETVERAFSLILNEPKVKGILVNIFGGITKCDAVAEGIVTAAKNLGVKVPLVVRLEGTNVASGKRILEESKLSIIVAEDLNDGALKVVKAVKEGV